MCPRAIQQPLLQDLNAVSNGVVTPPISYDDCRETDPGAESCGWEGVVHVVATVCVFDLSSS